MSAGATGASDPVARFAVAAERYCAWAERTPVSTEGEIETAVRFLLELTARALDLPDVEVVDEVDTERRDRAAFEAVLQRFRVLPVGLYGTLDPGDVVGESHLVGDVLDDLADVWRDVRQGLDAHRAGRIDEACWTWRFSFRNHWGAHATEALRVLVAKLHAA